MDDIPWIYVAMIFIAFIGWLRGRIRDAAEIRRQRSAQRKAEARARRTTEPEFESPYIARREEVVEEEPKTFREIFKEIERQINEAEEPEPEPVRPSRTPPPLPDTPPAYQTEEVPQPVRRTVKKPAPKPVQKREPASPEATITSILANKSQLRTALILSEVLDKPRALRRPGV